MSVLRSIGQKLGPPRSAKMKPAAKRADVGDYTYAEMSRCRAAALDIVKRVDVLPGNGISARCRYDKEI